MRVASVMVGALLVFAAATPARAEQAGGTEIEVRVCFLEVEPAEEGPRGLLTPPSPANALNALGTVMNEAGWDQLLKEFGNWKHADLLSAPVLRVLSGETGTVKVVTEYRFPTGVEVRPVVTTNGSTVTRGVLAAPSGFATRDVGVSLTAKPTFDPRRDRIDITIAAEVVTDPTWKDYAASYEDAQGTRQTLSLSQPFFHTRKITNTLTLRSGFTAIMGGMTSGGRRLVEDRVPILGAIPWLGRLFRSTRTVDDHRRLFIAVSATVVPPPKP